MKTRVAVLCAAALARAAEGQNFAAEAQACKAGKQKSCATILKAVRDKNEAQRLAAVPFLADAAALADVARNDTARAVRIAAISNPNLADAVLAALAADADVEVRKAAVARAADPALLAQAARSDASEPVRLAAVANPNLADQALLASLAADEKTSYSLLQAAVGRLTDQALLAQVATRRPDAPLGGTLMDRIVDPAALVQVATQAKSGASMQYLAARKLEEMVAASSDQELLLTVARADGYAARVHDLRSAAIKKLTDDETLVALAMEDRAGALAALERVQDPARIAAIAKSSASRNAAARAVNRLTDEAILLDVAGSAAHTQARVEAVRKMAKPSAAAWNGALQRAVQEKDWLLVERLAVRSLPPDAATKAALQQLAAANPSPYHASLARALAAGVPSSSWGRVRLAGGVSTQDLGTLTAPVPPGTYKVWVSYRGYKVASTSAVPLELVVRPKLCYVIESNELTNPLGLSTWRPAMKQEPCSDK